MILKKLFFKGLLVSCIMSPYIFPVAPGEIVLTPQEIEELQALEKAVADERARMSPEERAKFDKDVQDLQSKLERMPPEELDKFIKDNIFGYAEPQPYGPGEQPYTMPTAPAPQTVPQVKEAVPEIKQPTIPQDKIDALLKVINRIIASTNSFLAKTDRMAEFVAKFKKWTEQGKLLNWKPGMTWDVIKKQINDLLQDLHKIKEQDKKTKDYKYIHFAAEDENLVKALSDLAYNIEEEEQAIQVDEFGLEPVTRESRQSIRNVISSFLEAFTINNVLTALKNSKEKFEPAAQKYRTEEETATKKAGEESKIPRRVQPGVTAGQPEMPYYPAYTPSSGGYYGGGAPSYSGPSYGGAEGGPSAGAMRSFDDKSRGGEAGKPGAAGAPGKEDKDKSKDKDKGLEKHDDEKKSSSEKAKDIAAKRLIDKFDANLNSAVEALNDSPLAKISQYMQGTGDPDKQIVTVNLPNAIKKFQAAGNNLKSLKNRFKDLKDAQRGDYKASIKASYEEYQPTIDAALKQIRDARSNESKYPKKMSDAFLHGTYTLTDLQGAMEEMQKAYKDLVG